MLHCHPTRLSREIIFRLDRCLEFWLVTLLAGAGSEIDSKVASAWDIIIICNNVHVQLHSLVPDLCSRYNARFCAPVFRNYISHSVTTEVLSLISWTAKNIRMYFHSYSIHGERRKERGGNYEKHVRIIKGDRYVCTRMHVPAEWLVGGWVGW